MLRPTFFGFEAAKRGLSASQKGLDITGQNLTNWDSAGYTRQRVEQTALAASSYTSRFASNRIGVAGQGVDISGISQMRDSFLDKRFRDEQSEVGYFQTASALLSDIESALNEFQAETDTGLRASMFGLLESLQIFSSQSDSETYANIVLTGFKNMTQTLRQLDSKLQSVAGQQRYYLQSSVSELNQKLQKIAGINEAVSADRGVVTNGGHYGPNELLDERNLLLDELSALANIETTEHEDGSIDVLINGQLAVSGGKYQSIEMTENNAGIVSLRWVSSGKQVELASGSLKASTEFINGRGTNVTQQGETPLRGIRYYQDRLDTFASTLARVVNAAVPELDADGNPTGGTRLLLGGQDASGAVGDHVVVTAANISVSDAWSNDPSYLIYQSGSLQNNFALGLYNALSAGGISFLTGGETFSGSFLSYVDAYATTLGEDISFYGGRHEACLSISDTLNDSRDAISGVVVDEETVNIMLYNKSYQAAARLMTALDEALDVLINKTGLIGR